MTKRILGLGCFTLILAVLFAIYVITFRPSIFWEPVKNYLNAGQNDLAIEIVSQEEVYASINSQLKEDWKVTIDEAQLSSLLQNRFGSQREVYAKIYDREIDIYINVDDEGKPLWLIFRFREDDDGKVNLKSTGFVKISLPSRFTTFANDKLGLLLGILNKQAMNSVFMELLDESQIGRKLKIGGVEYEEDTIILDFSV